MKNPREDISSNKREFIDFLEKASSQKNLSNEKENNLTQKQDIHLNSLITKNVSLFSKNPNYKMLAWLLTQLTIFSLFILAMTILKNNIIPYLNSL
tara:strand:- start:2971 stop:3258 length:288 start_codon:yes stop_codon:yes gene_type:complete